MPTSRRRECATESEAAPGLAFDFAPSPVDAAGLAPVCLEKQLFPMAGAACQSFWREGRRNLRR